MKSRREFFLSKGADLVIPKPYEQGRIYELLELIYSKELISFR
jgi:hypothetical protein